MKFRRRKKLTSLFEYIFVETFNLHMGLINNMYLTPKNLPLWHLNKSIVLRFYSSWHDHEQKERGEKWNCCMIIPTLQWTLAPHLVLLKREWTTHKKDGIENQEHKKKIPTIIYTTITIWKKDKKHEENYNEYKVRMVVGDHGPPNRSHFKSLQSLKLPTIVNGVSHLNKCILYMNKNIWCNILVVG